MSPSLSCFSPDEKQSIEIYFNFQNVFVHRQLDFLPNPMISRRLYVIVMNRMTKDHLIDVYLINGKLDQTLGQRHLKPKKITVDQLHGTLFIADGESNQIWTIDAKNEPVANPIFVYDVKQLYFRNGHFLWISSSRPGFFSCQEHGRITNQVSVRCLLPVVFFRDKPDNK